MNPLLAQNLLVGAALLKNSLSRTSPNLGKILIRTEVEKYLPPATADYVAKQALENTRRNSWVILGGALAGALIFRNLFGAGAGTVVGYTLAELLRLKQAIRTANEIAYSLIRPQQNKQP